MQALSWCPLLPWRVAQHGGPGGGVALVLASLSRHRLFVASLNRWKAFWLPLAEIMVKKGEL